VVLPQKTRKEKDNINGEKQYGIAETSLLIPFESFLVVMGDFLLLTPKYQIKVLRKYCMKKGKYYTHISVLKRQYYFVEWRRTVE
jgi:hypothetical protein